MSSMSSYSTILFPLPKSTFFMIIKKLLKYTNYMIIKFLNYKFKKITY